LLKKFFKATSEAQVTLSYVTERETWIEAAVRLVGIYIFFFCARERIRSSKHGWNKPWLAELLVIRTTKRVPGTAQLHMDQITSGYFVNTLSWTREEMEFLSAIPPNPPREYDVPISRTKNSSRGRVV